MRATMAQIRFAMEQEKQELESLVSLHKVGAKRQALINRVKIQRRDQEIDRLNEEVKTLRTRLARMEKWPSYLCPVCESSFTPFLTEEEKDNDDDISSSNDDTRQ